LTSISKNSSITFISQVIIFALRIIISIILARILSPSGRGIYALIILIPTVMLKLGSLGMESANVYFTGSKQYKVKEITSNSLFSSVILGLILILLFFCIYHLNIFQDFLNSNQINLFYLWIIILTIPLSLLSGFLINIFLGEEKIITYNKINIFKVILNLITIIFFLLILRQGIFGAVFSYILTIIGTTLFVILLIRTLTKIRFSFNLRLFEDLTKYGLKTYFGNIAQFLNYRLDIFLVATFLSPAAVGFYSISVALAEKIWMLPGSIALVLFPRISSLKNTKANNFTPKVARNTFFIVFVFSLILAFFSRPLIRILFGYDFLPSVVPLLILLPGIIALSGAKTLTADLAGRGKPQFGTYASFISLGINVPLNLYFIPKWGISGAAFASSVAYIVATFIIIIFFIKISKKSWVDVLLIKKKDFQYYKNFFSKIKGMSL